MERAGGHRARTRAGRACGQGSDVSVEAESQGLCRRDRVRAQGNRLGLGGCSRAHNFAHAVWLLLRVLLLALLRAPWDKCSPDDVPPLNRERRRDVALEELLQFRLRPDSSFPRVSLSCASVYVCARCLFGGFVPDAFMDRPKSRRLRRGERPTDNLCRATFEPPKSWRCLVEPAFSPRRRCLVDMRRAHRVDPCRGLCASASAGKRGTRGWKSAAAQRPGPEGDRSGHRSLPPR